MNNTAIIKLIKDAYRPASINSLSVTQLVRMTTVLTKRNLELMLEYGNHFELHLTDFTTEVSNLLNSAGIHHPEYRERFFKNYRYCPYASFIFFNSTVTRAELEQIVSLMNAGLIMLFPDHNSEIPHLSMSKEGLITIDPRFETCPRADFSSYPAMIAIPKDLLVDTGTAHLHFDKSSPQFNRYTDLLTKITYNKDFIIEDEVYFTLVLLDSAILKLKQVFKEAANGNMTRFKELLECWKPAVDSDMASDSEILTILQDSEINFIAGWFINLNSMTSKRRIHTLEVLSKGSLNAENSIAYILDNQLLVNRSS